MNRYADWLKQAARDLEAAEASARAGLHEWAAFAAQQSGEKAVKALLESRHAAVRGHAITLLLGQAQGVQMPPAILEAARELDKVYVTARDPNGLPAGIPADYFSEESSRRLLQHARDILEFCRSQIP